MCKSIWSLAFTVVLTLILVACAVPTAIPPTATAVPPTATPIPPTATPIPPTATPIPPTATPVPPTVDVAAIKTAAAATVLAQLAADQTATAAARPTNTPLPTATNTSQPTATPTPQPTARPTTPPPPATAAPAQPTAAPKPTQAAAGGFTINLINIRYEQWGRPDPVKGCQAFDDKNPVRKFNVDITVTNNSSRMIEDWYPGFWSNTGKLLRTCFYVYGGGFPAIPVGESRTVTFAAFCELNEAVVLMRMDILDQQVYRCFSPSGAIVACP
jgi:hypothetical protein